MTNGNQRLDLNEALERLAQKLVPKDESERVPVSAARGRVLAQAIDAPVSLPPFPSSAMDGYALQADARLQAGASYRVVGTSAAGHPFAGRIAAGECVRIFTGAVVPADTDTVIIQEDVEPLEAASIRISDAPEPGANVRAVGHDVSRGENMLAAGEVLSAFHIGWLAACGIAQVDVRPLLNVGLIATGDELIAPGGALGPGQIYDSNRTLLHELLRRQPVAVRDFGLLPDAYAATESGIAEAARQVDVLLCTGGASVGERDFVTDVLSALGQLEFWRLNLKPGKPVAVGKIDTCWFFGLPGNPVSCALTALLIALPALRRLAGATSSEPMRLNAQLRGTISHRAGREEYQRGHLQADAAGNNRVEPTGDQSSNRLASLAQANCLIRIPKEAGNLVDGTPVEVLPLQQFAV